MFGKTVVIAEKSIAEKTGDALGMFHKAVSQLKDINAEAEIIKQQNDEKINALVSETQELERITGNNGKVIKNIEKLITVG
jgi:predicted RNA-binding protein Jag